MIRTVAVLVAFTALAAAQGEVPHLPAHIVSRASAEAPFVMHGCGHTNLPKPDVGCGAHPSTPNHCEEVSIPADFKDEYIKAVGWKYPKYTAGPCSSRFTVAEAKWNDFDFPKAGVSHTKRGLATTMVSSPYKQIHSIDGGNHCYQLTVSSATSCFKQFWDVHHDQDHQYEKGWSAGECPSKFNIVNKHEEVCTDGSVVTEYRGIGSVQEDRWESNTTPLEHSTNSISKHYVHPTEPHCEDIIGVNTASAWWKQFSWRYDTWKGGKCDSKTFDFVNEVDHPTSGVTHRTLGKKPKSAVPNVEFLSEVLPLLK